MIGLEVVQGMKEMTISSHPGGLTASVWEDDSFDGPSEMLYGFTVGLFVRMTFLKR